MTTKRADFPTYWPVVVQGGEVIGLYPAAGSGPHDAPAGRVSMMIGTYRDEAGAHRKCWYASPAHVDLVKKLPDFLLRPPHASPAGPLHLDDRIVSHADPDAEGPATTGILKPTDLELRPCLAVFAMHMELALRRHDPDRGPRGWIGDEPGDLLNRAVQEMGELIGALAELHAVVRKGRGMDPVQTTLVVRECADLANFAMMLADNLCDRLDAAGGTDAKFPVGSLVIKYGVPPAHATLFRVTLVRDMPAGAPRYYCKAVRYGGTLGFEEKDLEAAPQAVLDEHREWLTGE